MGHVHGFFYFYFINEQVLRFLGKRYPVDYNKLPFVLYWGLHLVWLFPWSIYLPVVLRRAWADRTRWDCSASSALFRSRTNALLAIYAAVILVFFSLSTNQEYYTFPVYFPLLLLMAGALAGEEAETPSKWLTRTQLFLVGLVWLPRSLWDMDCGLPANFLPAATLARFWRIATLPGIRSRWRTCSILPALPLPLCVCPLGWPRLDFCWVRWSPGCFAARAPFRGHGQRCVHLRCVSHRGAYCLGALRTDAFFACHG